MTSDADHQRPTPFDVGDEVLWGKYKNKVGKIVRFGRNHKGQLTVEIEPIPKGRKHNKELGLFKIWTTADDVQAVTAAKASVSSAFASVSDARQSREPEAPEFVGWGDL